MRKIVSVIMMVMLAAGVLWAQGAGDADDGQVVVAFAQGELVNAWRVTNQKDMEAWAKELGIKLISTNADQDPAKQLADVQNLLAQRPDALVMPPTESTALVPVVKMCNDAGVPLIVIDRTIDAEPGVGMYKTEISQSHVISGELLAERTVELLTEKYGSPRGNVVHVQGQAGASPVIDANEGWAKVMKDYPEIKEIAVADAGFTTEGGLKVMEDFLQRFPKGQIDVVRTDYSAMTIGALQAIKAAGRNELLGYVVGEGGHYLAIEEVVAGNIALETQTPPYFGELALKSVLKILNGEEVPARQEVPIKVFDNREPEFAKAYLDEIRAKGLEF
jgi:ABC-type sugar transport system substrate-binding protein